MATIINYASSRTTSVGTTLRFALLKQGTRVPTTYTITLDSSAHSAVNVQLAAPVAIGATTLTVNALSAAIPNKSKITFANGASVRLAAAASSAATSLTIEPSIRSIPNGMTGTYAGGQLTSGADFIPVVALPVDLWPGERLTFGGVSVTVADRAPAGSVDIEVITTTAALTASATATTNATLYIAGATDASPSSSPKLVDGSNFLSGAGNEQIITGTNRTLNFTFQNIEGDPGAEVLKNILYNDAIYNREIYAWLTRANGEQYRGACIPTTGDQSSPVQDLVTITANLQFQGASFAYTPATGAPTLDLSA